MKYKGPGSTSNSTNNEVGQENEKSLKKHSFSLSTIDTESTIFRMT